MFAVPTSVGDFFLSGPLKWELQTDLSYLNKIMAQIRLPCLPTTCFQERERTQKAPEISGQTRLFVSHARDDDEPFVKPLYEDLPQRAFNVWWDSVATPSRALTVLHEIRDAIGACGRLVLVVGPHVLRSDYVHVD